MDLNDMSSGAGQGSLSMPGATAFVLGIRAAGRLRRKYALTLVFAAKPKGTGLGLRICYQIVSQHHGNLDVVSKPIKGTTFNVSPPIAAGRSETHNEVAE